MSNGGSVGQRCRRLEAARDELHDLAEEWLAHLAGEGFETSPEQFSRRAGDFAGRWQRRQREVELLWEGIAAVLETCDPGLLEPVTGDLRHILATAEDLAGRHRDVARRRPEVAAVVAYVHKGQVLQEHVDWLHARLRQIERHAERPTEQHTEELSLLTPSRPPAVSRPVESAGGVGESGLAVPLVPPARPIEERPVEVAAPASVPPAPSVPPPVAVENGPVLFDPRALPGRDFYVPVVLSWLFSIPLLGAFAFLWQRPGLPAPSIAVMLAMLYHGSMAAVVALTACALLVLIALVAAAATGRRWVSRLSCAVLWAALPLAFAAFVVFAVLSIVGRAAGLPG